MRPRLLDLFCGAGGAAMGYHRAGFDVTGMDIKEQPRYPFKFLLGDVMAHTSVPGIVEYFGPFDAIHASPPCKAHSARTPDRSKHSDLLTPIRDLLNEARLPWVIENVPGAPMRADLKLCGCMFGLPGLRRERWFETSPQLFEMRPPCRHTGQTVTVVGGGADYRAPHRSASLAIKHAAMGIDWMSRDELAQAIPPAYTEHIGRHLLAALEAAA